MEFDADLAAPSYWWLSGVCINEASRWMNLIAYLRTGLDTASGVATPIAFILCWTDGVVEFVDKLLYCCICWTAIVWSGDSVSGVNDLKTRLLNYLISFILNWIKNRWIQSSPVFRMWTEPRLSKHSHVWLPTNVGVHWWWEKIVLRAVPLKWWRRRLTVLTLRCLWLQINIVFTTWWQLINKLRFLILHFVHLDIFVKAFERAVRWLACGNRRKWRWEITWKWLQRVMRLVTVIWHIMPCIDFLKELWNISLSMKIFLRSLTAQLRIRRS